MRVRTHDEKRPWLSRLLTADRALVAAKATGDAKKISDAEKEMEDAEAGVNGALGEETGGDHTHLHIHQDEGTVANGNAGIGSGLPVKMTDEEVSKGFKDIRDGMEKLSKTVDAIAEKVGYKGEDAEATKELEGQIEEESSQTGDKARKAHDSVYMVDSCQAAAAAAEIMVPGISIPAFSKGDAPKKTFDALTRLRRSALDLLDKTPAGRAMIEAVNGKPLTLDSMQPGQVRTLFNAVAAMKKQGNRAQHAGDGRMQVHDAGMMGKRITTADIQRMNEEARAKRQQKAAA